MKKPCQCQRSIARPVKQHRRLAAALPGHWTPSPLSPGRASEHRGRLLVGSGSKCFSKEEEELLIKLHALLGNRWTLIAGRLPGRTGKEVESHWNSKMRSKLKREGVDDPDNHRSLTTLLGPVDDERQRRRRPRELCEAERPGKHPSRCLSSNVNDDSVSDAGSCCRAQQELAYGLNLELSLSPPCMYFGGTGQVTEL
ncbi:hypothetical protein QOZ80_1BG0056850 [Eleusine coracana subsp. coracana]|nr:hypothetical protein QOZ80_1BG0056850 [Eleusine coracana subsp. coracana]